MFKLIKKYTKQYTIYALLAPIVVGIEVYFDVLIPNVMSKIIKEGVEAGSANMSIIYKYGLLMLFYSLLALISGVLAGYFASKASGGFIYNLRLALFDKIQQYSFNNIEKFEVPSLVNRITKDMREFRMAYVSIVRISVRAPLLLIMSMVMALKINASLAWIFAVALPILGLGLYLIASHAHPLFRKLFVRFDQMNASLEENFITIRVVKTFVREAFEKVKFKKTSEDVLDNQRKAEQIVILNGPFFNLVMYSCMIAISFIGGNHIIAGKMDTADFMAYLSYMKSILFALLLLSNALMQIVMAQAAVDRANEILDEKIDITDENADASLTVEDGSIEFKDVSFAYSKNSENMALSNINLKINSGEMIGIIGSTGSSKSTLVQLIPRLYDASKGEVIVSGHNVKEYNLKILRDSVAMVLQKNVLFTGTIEENLKWGNENATHEMVVAMAKVAQADDFINTLPNGYETDLGQGGVNVSGGQQQRLCIARALLKNPKIIILDDSTSAVDTDTDKRIRKALKQELSGMTSIIIAQRIASIMECDKIVVMDNGHIVDIGNHQELLKRNDVYADLYNTQAKGVSE